MSQQINLFNPDFRKKRELFSALMLAQTLGVLVVLCAGLYGYEYRGLQQERLRVKSDATLLESERADLVAVLREFAPRDRNATLEKQVEGLDQRLKGEQAVLDVLKGGSLGNTRGYSEYMRAFARQAVAGVWLTDFTIKGAGIDMAIGGRTLRPELVPAYIQRLNQESVLQGRAFAALEMQQPKASPATADQPAQVPNYLEFRLYSSAVEEKKP